MKSEFQKRMDLLDPGYVAPASERVSNRKSFAINTEPIKVNEAGLPILEDQPVSPTMQELYKARMMDVGSLDGIDLPESKVNDQAVDLLIEIAKQRRK